MFKSILVAVDGSRDSDIAVRAAVEIARAQGAELNLCHVSYIPPQYTDDLMETLREAIRSDGEEILLHAEKLVESLGVDAKGHLLTKGHPAEAVVDFAKEGNSDLIVVGVRGMTPERRRAMGSVSHSIAENAACSVLMVRPPVAEPTAKV